MSDQDFDDEPYITSWHKQDKTLSNEEIIQRQTDFQQVLETPAGHRVMGQLLSDLCFFRRCETPEEVALNNYGKKLLSYQHLPPRSSQRGLPARNVVSWVESKGKGTSAP